MTVLSEQIKELHGRGLSYSQIQRELGCSKGSISYHLGVGQREKTVARNRDKRNLIRKYYQEVKQSSVCADCKEDYPYWMMDFDHLEGKDFGVASFQGKTASLEAVKKEIEKCDVVCANCHRNRTHMRLVKDGGDVADVSLWYTV